MDDSEFWIDSDGDEEYDEETEGASADPTFFQLGLERVGQQGGS